MREGVIRSAAGRQELVDAYFDSGSEYWKNVYSDGGLVGEIYRNRRDLVLAWVDELGLAEGSRVLEIGSGAGYTSLSLAARGYAVEAIDGSAEMVELTRGHAAQAGLNGALKATQGDAHALRFEDASFDAVVALGIVPWLHSPERALREVARVTKPGGHIALTADNRARLSHLLDPRLNPLLGPARTGAKRALEATGLRERQRDGFDRRLHYPREIDRLLAEAGLRPVRRATVGFGPFTVAGRAVLGERTGVGLHRRLQALAARGLPALRFAGSHYVVLAEKPHA